MPGCLARMKRGITAEPRDCTVLVRDSAARPAPDHLRGADSQVRVLDRLERERQRRGFALRRHRGPLLGTPRFDPRVDAGVETPKFRRIRLGTTAPLAICNRSAHGTRPFEGQPHPGQQRGLGSTAIGGSDTAIQPSTRARRLSHSIARSWFGLRLDQRRIILVRQIPKSPSLILRSPEDSSPPTARRQQGGYTNRAASRDRAGGQTQERRQRMDGSREELAGSSSAIVNAPTHKRSSCDHKRRPTFRVLLEFERSNNIIHEHAQTDDDHMIVLDIVHFVRSRCFSSSLFPHLQLAGHPLKLRFDPILGQVA